MHDTSTLTPLQRDALIEAYRSPTRSLVRTRGGYSAQHQRQTTSGLKHVRLFTGRLMNMLDREGLVDLDPPQFPDRVTLNKHGLALAQQIDAEAARKAVRL